MDIIRTVIISTALDVPKRIFAVLYVSVMGLTRCYKTTVFYIYNRITAEFGVVKFSHIYEVLIYG